MSSTPSLADVLTAILNGIITILHTVATLIRDNASVIGSLIVLGGLAYGVYRFGGRIVRELSGMFRVFG